MKKATKKQRTFILIVFAVLGFNLGSAIQAAEEPKASVTDKPIYIKVLQPHEWPIITTTGRLFLNPVGEEERIALLARDGSSYYIKGELEGKTKEILSELGENNLVTVTGKQSGSYDISCRNTYSFDLEGNRTVDTQCNRYYHLEITKILNAQQSDEEMPPPERDIEEERKARAAALTHLLQQELTQIAELRGEITSLNLRSPIKTMEVAFRDKDGQELKKNLLLTSNTRIVKKSLQEEELMYLSINSLRVGQEVNIVHSRDERKTEALFITIMKE